MIAIVSDENTLIIGGNNGLADYVAISLTIAAHSLSQRFFISYVLYKHNVMFRDIRNMYSGMYDNPYNNYGNIGLQGESVNAVQVSNSNNVTLDDQSSSSVSIVTLLLWLD